jgi:hypothetical protein
MNIHLCSGCDDDRSLVKKEILQYCGNFANLTPNASFADLSWALLYWAKCMQWLAGHLDGRDADRRIYDLSEKTRLTALDLLNRHAATSSNSRECDVLRERIHFLEEMLMRRERSVV